LSSNVCSQGPENRSEAEIACAKHGPQGAARKRGSKPGPSREAACLHVRPLWRGAVCWSACSSPPFGLHGVQATCASLRFSRPETSKGLHFERTSAPKASRERVVQGGGTPSRMTLLEGRGPSRPETSKGLHSKEHPFPGPRDRGHPRRRHPFAHDLPGRGLLVCLQQPILRAARCAGYLRFAPVFASRSVSCP
jgi:hypothetical protein